MVQNSTLSRDILGKMPPACLQNCPRASGPRAVLEARGSIFPRMSRERVKFCTKISWAANIISCHEIVPWKKSQLRRAVFESSSTSEAVWSTNALSGKSKWGRGWVHKTVLPSAMAYSFLIIFGAEV